MPRLDDQPTRAPDMPRDHEAIPLHEFVLAPNAYALQGQLVGGLLSDHVDALVDAPGAPGGDCERCRLRCCSYLVDAVDPEVPGLLAAAERLGVSPSALLEVPTRRDEPGTRRLKRQADGRCVMLDADHLCRIHAAEGIEAKPMVCQLYPGQLVVTPTGARSANRPECPWPRPTDDPAAVDRWRRLLRRRAPIDPDVFVRLAPEVVRLDGDATAPWAEFDLWLADAVDAAAAAPSAMAALDAAVALLIGRFSLPRPAVDSMRTRMLAGALSGMLESIEAPTTAAPFVAIACAEPAPDPRPCPPALVESALTSLEPLRFRTALAGLGVIRLFIGAADRDPRAAETPREVLAALFRKLSNESVRLPLARSSTALLEAVAVDPLL